VRRYCGTLTSYNGSSFVLPSETSGLKTWGCYLNQKIRIIADIIINRSEDSSFEEDLAQDVLEIITVFSARLYGSRSHRNKQIVEHLREVAKELK